MNPDKPTNTMKTTPIIEAAQEMSNLFSQIENIYNSLTEEEKEFIADYHSEGYNIPHSIRWGIQASSELQNVTRKEYKKWLSDNNY